MSERAPAFVVAFIALGLAVAQDVVPGRTFYHSWQYALVLGVALLVVATAFVGALRARDGMRSYAAALALAGAAIAGVAGLASGLLGPDTTQVIGTPGTVVPVPALGAAAFFGAADGDAIANGDGSIVLRIRGRAPIDVSAGHHLLGESIIGIDRRPAAFIEAWDTGGAHLTITQPANASFLSPVLLFRDHQRIGNFDVPFDGFATPARARGFRALYFSPADLANFKHAVADTTKPALIITAADDRGTPLGITLVPSGRSATIAGVRVRATLGTYPALSIASAPPAWALVAGGLCFVLGLTGVLLPPRRSAAQPATAVL
jgi:hypothetical protein